MDGGPLDALHGTLGPKRLQPCAKAVSRPGLILFALPPYSRGIVACLPLDKRMAQT
jgi:hypothetical protein